MKLSLRPAAAGLFVLALALSGCQNTEGGSEQSSAEAVSDQPQFNEQPYENVKDGGTLTSDGSFSGDDTQGNPWHTNTTSAGWNLWDTYNPRAISFSPTGEVEVNPDYYTEAEATMEDGKQVVRFTINDKATYNDGTPIDWRSLEATWKVANGSDPDFPVGGTAGWEEIESVERGDSDKQAVVTFSKPYLAWPQMFATFINPKAATVENFNEAYSNKVQPDWGAGPFTVESYDPNSKRAVFKRNDNWWGKPAKLERRIFIDLADAQAVANSFRNGQIDYMEAGTAELQNQVEGTPDSEKRSAIMSQVRSMYINSRSEALSDIEVRKAVVQAIDRQQIADIYFQGTGYSEDLPGSVIYYPFQSEYNDNFSEAVETGADKANETLDAAGYEKDSEGMRSKDGKPLALTYTLYSDSPVHKAVAQSTVEALKKAGIAAEIKTITSAQWASELNERKFDLMLGGGYSTNPFGAFNAPGYFDSEAEGNPSGTGTPENDKRITEALSSDNLEEQAKLANEAEKEGFEQFGIIPLNNGPSVYYTKKGLANVGASIFYKPLPETIGWQKDD